MPEKSIQLFLEQRRQEIEWRNLNGFDNGDPDTNGELRVLETLCPHFGVFVDVGANLGHFSQSVLSFCPEISVVAFEPNPELLSDLKMIVGRRGVVHDVAISDERGNTILRIHPSDAGVSSLFARHDMMPSFTDQMTEHPVAQARGDDFLGEILEYEGKAARKGVILKIDIEGGEFPAIRSFSGALRRMTQVVVMFEYSSAWANSGNSLCSAFHFLDESGYQTYRLTPLGLERIKFFAPFMEDHAYCNYLGAKGIDLEALLDPRVIDSRCGKTPFLVYPTMPPSA